LQFVGFEPLENAPLPIGSHVRGDSIAHPSDGYISSAAFSPTLRRWVALGMLRAGRARLGEAVSLLTPHGIATARVAIPCSYDPQGTRIHA
jgi:sarcosine oxidase, subunit alpha